MGNELDRRRAENMYRVEPYGLSFGVQKWSVVSDNRAFAVCAEKGDALLIAELLNDHFAGRRT